MSIVPGEVQTATHVSGGEPVSLTRMLPWIWLTGVGCMLLYMALSCLRMWAKVRKRPTFTATSTAAATSARPSCWACSPPHLSPRRPAGGRPAPGALHERCHIRRGDHIVKPLAFLLLAFHWFNPALWLAYVLLGRDMERACDELALKNADAAGRAAHTRALVSCAARPARRRCVAFFGEIAVKEACEERAALQKSPPCGPPCCWSSPPPPSPSAC